MTENEARLILDVRISRFDHAGDVNEALEIAKQALEEIQQYRKINTEIKQIFDGQLGLIDVLKGYIEDIKRTHNGEKPRKIIALSNEDADKWESYKKIGTVEECREAVEKQIQKKCAIDSCPDHTHYKCPSCGQIELSIYKHGFPRLGRITKYCENCGQALQQEDI